MKKRSKLKRSSKPLSAEALGKLSPSKREAYHDNRNLIFAGKVKFIKQLVLGGMSGRGLVVIYIKDLKENYPDKLFEINSCFLSY